MTNRELLTAPKQSLSVPERQRQFLLRTVLSPMPCPACLKPIDALAAAGIDLDEFDFGATELHYACPHCSASLSKTSPQFGTTPGWYWQLDAVWLADRLEKARAYERERPTGE